MSINFPSLGRSSHNAVESVPSSAVNGLLRRFGAIMLLVSGCAHQEFDISAGIVDEDVRCGPDYFDVFSDEAERGDWQAVAIFGATTADVDQSEFTYPLGSIEHYGDGELSEAKFFLFTGEGVMGGTEVAVSGDIFGYELGGGGSSVPHPVDDVVYCDDGGFMFTVFNPLDSDKDIYGAGMLRVLEEHGEAWTYHGNTRYFTDSEHIETRVTEDGNEVVNDLPSQQIADFVIGQPGNDAVDGVETISDLQDAIFDSSDDVIIIDGFRTY